MSCPLRPNKSLTPLPSFTLPYSNCFCTRFLSCATCAISFLRRRVSSRKSRVALSGIKLGGFIPCRGKDASHHASVASVLWPFRFFTSTGLANTTWIAASSRLNTGTQYGPVLSMTACVTPSSCNHSRSFSKHSLVQSTLRISALGSSFSGPFITQTFKNVLPTSMPAHRSTTAAIMLHLWRAQLLPQSNMLFYELTGSIPGHYSSQGQVHPRVLPSTR